MADLSALTDAINALDADVKTLMAASGSTDQAAIDVATAQLQALDTQVLAATNATVPPAPTPPSTVTTTDVPPGTIS